MLYQLDRAIGYASDGANILRHQIEPTLTGVGYGILLNRTLAKKITWWPSALLPVVFAALEIAKNAAQQQLNRIPGSIFYMNSIVDRINRVGQQQLEYLADPHHSARKLTCKAIVLSILLARTAAIGYLAGSAATYTCNYFGNEKLKGWIEFGLKTQGVNSIEPIYAAAMSVAFLLFGQLMPDNDQKKRADDASNQYEETDEKNPDLIKKLAAENRKAERAEVPFVHLLYEELKNSSKKPEPEIKVTPNPDVVDVYAKLLSFIAATQARGLICTTVVMAAIPQATVILPTVTGCAIAVTALAVTEVALQAITHYGKRHAHQAT